jgi:hypothetical protein
LSSEIVKTRQKSFNDTENTSFGLKILAKASISKAFNTKLAFKDKF